jgi:hypothetical protein
MAKPNGCTDGRADALANPISEETVFQIESIARDLVSQMSAFLE